MVDASTVEKFWKPALAVGGIASVGAFVFYSLNKKWLELEIFSRLSSNHTFIIMLVFLVLVCIVALAMLTAWFFDRARTEVVSTKNSITYDIPESWSFKQAATALASEGNSVIDFKGFSEEELSITLNAQAITANTTLRAIELLKALGQKNIPAYSVDKLDGQFIVKTK